MESIRGTAAISRGLSAALACVVVLVNTSGPAPAATAAFGDQVALYVRESQERNPLFADRLGIYDYDDRLPDLSAAGHADEMQRLRRWRATFAAATPNEPLAVAADRAALLDRIDATLIEDEAVAPWRNDPAVYVGAVGAAIGPLLIRTDQSVDVRMANVAKRLTRIPALAASAIANLDRPTRVAAELASGQLAGTLRLYRDRIPAAAMGASAAQQAAVTAALPAALTAIEQFKAFVDGPLLARADRSPRVGAAVYDRLFALRGGVTTPRAEVIARARAAMATTRERMLAIAEPLHRTLLPNVPITATGDARTTAVIRDVINAVAMAHPTRATILDVARNDVARIEAFIERSRIVPLPVPNTLEVRETPAYQAGVAGASLQSAGPYAPLATAYFNVDPIPASFSDELVESYLRENNDYQMQLLAIHEAVPGHYVQGRFGLDQPSLTRKIFGNGAFAEGWACFTEGMMLDAGYGEGDPKLRLIQLKFRLREYANAIVDAEYHAGSLTHDEGIALLVDGAFQERAEAEAKWHRLELSYGQLATYFIGLDAIETARAHSTLSVPQFNTRLLEMGSVEPRFIEPLLGQPVAR